MTSHNRDDVVSRLITTGRYDRSAADQALTDVFAAVINLTAAGPVTLHGIGGFERVHAAARVGRNPQNGTPVSIPPTVRLKFRPATTVNDAIRNGTEITGRRKTATTKTGH